MATPSVIRDSSVHTLAQLLATLGVDQSFSRPHDTDDNPFSEAQYKTLK